MHASRAADEATLVSMRREQLMTFFYCDFLISKAVVKDFLEGFLKGLSFFIVFGALRDSKADGLAALRSSPRQVEIWYFRGRL